MQNYCLSDLLDVKTRNATTARFEERLGRYFGWGIGWSKRGMPPLRDLRPDRASTESSLSVVKTRNATTARFEARRHGGVNIRCSWSKRGMPPLRDLSLPSFADGQTVGSSCQNAECHHCEI